MPAAADASPVQTARTQAAGHDAKGVFWFDLSEEHEFLVYLYLPERDVTLRRRVPEASQSVEAAIESMWIIVRSGALSLARGVAIEMETVDPEAITTEPVPPPDPEPVPAPASDPTPPPERKMLGLGLSASYLGLGFARRVTWQSGAALELFYRLHPIVRLGLGYGLVAGMRVEEPAELRIARHEVAVVLGVGGWVTDRLGLVGRVAPSLELVQWNAPESNARSLQPAAKVSLEGLAQIRVAPRLAVDVAPGLDFGLTTFAFVLCGEPAESCSGDARALVLAPWRVRPRARAGITAFF